ncbi:hypothetical protein B0G69_4206 [Paraburkholderia sp. RAU2J]|nr:hypothetical protein B0G69_4206 [Paraburkholderia sp. RAU2J]
MTLVLKERTSTNRATGCPRWVASCRSLPRKSRPRAVCRPLRSEVVELGRHPLKICDRERYALACCRCCSIWLHSPQNSAFVQLECESHLLCSLIASAKLFANNFKWQREGMVSPAEPVGGKPHRRVGAKNGGSNDSTLLIHRIHLR